MDPAPTRPVDFEGSALPEPAPAHPGSPAPGPGGPLGFIARLAARLGWRLNLLLLLATAMTTTLSWLRFEGPPAPGQTTLSWLASGLTYSIPVLVILGSHELGHYVLCRRYGVRATLPYFIPAPTFVLSGTFGAVIRMRPPIPSRRALFDIGIAGPIAGFVVAIPVLAYGVATAAVETLPQGGSYWVFGDPLLARILARMTRGSLAPGSDYIMNGFTLAGWFGLLVTAMNLFPVGQLDGGHVAYALSRSLHRATSRLTIAGMIALVAGSLLAPFSSLWPIGVIGAVLLWASWKRLPRLAAQVAGVGTTAFVAYALLVGVFTPWLPWTVLLIVLGRHPHPPVENETEPVGAARTCLALFAIFMFVLCFIPVPLDVIVVGR